MSNRISMTEGEIADAVIGFRERNGRDPRATGDTLVERYLARKMWKLRDPAAAARVGTKVPRGDAKALAVVAFIQRTGHTPRMNQPDEKELGQWLITYARPRHREGRLPKRVEAILAATPIALRGRENPDPQDRMEELRDFIAENNRLPRQHVEGESVLAAWMYAQRPSMRKEGTEAHARCVQVQELIDPYRGRNTEARREARIEAIRGHVEQYGYLPKASAVAGLESEFEGVMTYAEHKREARLDALVQHISDTGHLPVTDPSDPMWVMIYRARKGTDDFSARVRAAVEGHTPPTTKRAERRTAAERIGDLRAFIAERGVLPGPSTDGNLYRWMYYASQRDDQIARTLRDIMAATPKAPRGRPKKEQK